MRSLRGVSGLCAFVVLFAANIFAQEVGPVPRFERSECAITVPDGEKNVECGYLTVRENRSLKTSRTIRLPVVILKSEMADTKPDPVLRMLGGPGASSLKLIRGRRSSPWLKSRDMIILEQRGAQYSEPNLDCPEVKEAKIAAVKQRASESEAGKREMEAVKLCRERLVGAGVDLSAYNSAESAADIEDLRRSLKLEKLNLYGLSYSVRIMLEVARDFPRGVRSLVLESNLLPEINYDEVGVDGIVRVLDLLFARCREDAKCAKSFPDVEKEFYRMVKQANAAPLDIDAKDPKTGETFKIRLTGNDLAEWVIDYLLSNEPEAITYAPLLIYMVANGDLKVRPLQNYANDKLGGGFYSLGLRYSVWCQEETPFENFQKINAQENKYPGLNGYKVQTLPAICGEERAQAALPDCKFLQVLYSLLFLMCRK